MSWFPFRRSMGSSSDPDDVGKNLKWLETVLQDDRTRLDEVEAKAAIDAQAENRKKELKEWAYDAEDVLDEWKFEQLRATVEAPRASTCGRRYARDPVTDLLMDASFRRRVNVLKRRREEIGKVNRTLRLGKAQGSGRHGRNVEPPPSSSLPGERHIFGREDDRKMLVEYLKSNEVLGESLTVVPIVGAAGVGKTAFVRHVYNDPEVSKHFKPKGWVSVSRGLQMMKLMGSIVEALTEDACNYGQLGVVQDLLKRKTNGQRFLLVLDNVWYETVDQDHWEKLCVTFRDCAGGSVIILTTRDELVAKKTGTVPSYILECLSGDLCWSVFQEHAFDRLSTDARLVEIGKDIAKECQGSPLVAKALGVRLRHERDVEKWEEFLQRDMWDEVVPELKLSYHHLPAHLKRCFVYCSMFPKGYLFNREELVQLWMAQGFIEEKRERLLKDVELEYFDDLSIMSFFQKSELDTGAFVMPTALHALAQSVSDGESLTIEDSNLRILPRNDLQKLRHLSLKPTNGELTTNSLSFATHLRSFLVVPAWPLKKIVHISLSDETLHSLNRLRMLDVRHTDIVDLPNTIGNLKHLRYLNVSGTKMKNIHASVFRLYNLQTLDLSRTAIRELPDAIGNLSNLLHLRLNVTQITKLPESIGKLSMLQTLHLGFTKIEELPETIGNLKWLRFLCLNVSKIQRLPESIRQLSNLQTLELQGADDEESKNHATLIDRYPEEQLNEHSDQIILNQDVNDMADSSIKSLHIDDQVSSSNDTVKEEDVFENLQPHPNFQKLDIRFYDDVRFLMWMGDPSFSKLTHVVLKNHMKCKTLPQLGQLSLLKELDIDGMSVEHVGQDFCGQGNKNGFPSLEKLSFQNMSKWKEWDGVKKGDFPHLVELILFNCPKLKGVPCFLAFLTKLKVERCAVNTIPTTESLEDLQVCACDNLSELLSLNSLRNLTLMYCRKLRSLPSVPLLEKLWIEECEQLLPCSISLPCKLKIVKLSSTVSLAVPRLLHDEHVGT